MGRIPKSSILTLAVGLLVALMSSSVGFFLHPGIVKSLFSVSTVVGLSLVFLASLGWVWYERPEGTAEVAGVIDKWGTPVAILVLLVIYLVDAN